MLSNPQLELAYNFVQYTDRNIFLTGKAGTGKTTFLHHLKKTALKRMVVVAPTGVAAINAGGVTIHSLFQLPFGPFVAKSVAPAGKVQQDLRYLRFNRDKINLLKSLDLLVIDEISMVRADTLDGIDEVFRRFKDPRLPFGGVQVLMIGDLHQLAPVVKDEDWKVLADFYPNLYFFSSKALQTTPMVNIELKHIFRQTDARFIDLLNHIRENRLDAAVLSRLNERYLPEFSPADDEGYITLTTHNHTANSINLTQLDRLPGEEWSFTATVENDFPEYAFPTSLQLVLKTGAQVMFVKNDSSREKLFYNGKIGRVTRISEGIVYVKCGEDEEEIGTGPAEWKNTTYTLNPETREVEEKVVGSFSQYPLKLAWAITIHKSQGLTFDRAIIDAGASFAHGQVYVALSRCKTFEGLVLRTPIALNSVRMDGTVSTYTRQAEENAPDEAQLLLAKARFQHALLLDLLEFSTIKTRIFQFQRIVQEHHHTLGTALLSAAAQLKDDAEKSLYPVADSFKRQLAPKFAEGALPEDDAWIQERVSKAAVWFHREVKKEFYERCLLIDADSDNKEVKKQLQESLQQLMKELYVKLCLFQSCESGFSTRSYLQVRSNAELDFQDAVSKAPVKKTVPVSADTEHPALYEQLKSWRNALAAERNVPVYLVMPQKALSGIASALPSSSAELEQIHGIGKKKIDQYGAAILAIVDGYRTGLTNASTEEVQPLPPA